MRRRKRDLLLLHHQSLALSSMDLTCVIKMRLLRIGTAKQPTQIVGRRVKRCYHWGLMQDTHFVGVGVGKEDSGGYLCLGCYVTEL